MTPKIKRLLPLSFILISLSLLICVTVSFYTIFELRSITKKTQLMKQNISNCALTLTRLIYASTDLLINSDESIEKRIDLSRKVLSQGKFSIRQLDTELLDSFLDDDPLLLKQRNTEYEEKFSVIFANLKTIYDAIEHDTDLSNKRGHLDTFKSETKKLFSLLESRSFILSQIEAHYFSHLKNSVEHLMFHLNSYLAVLSGITVLVIAVSLLYIISRKNTITALKSHRDQLEIEVESRTSEWVKANKKLEFEVQERKSAEEKIAANLKEKELLLKEIHHRVKNNMAVISGLLNLQMMKITDEKTKEILLDSQNRIQTMSMVHQALYQSETLSSINMKEYLINICKSVTRGYKIKQHIDLEFEVDDVRLIPNQASPIGLIINELLVNALKYAFPGDRKGVFRISSQIIEKDCCELTVTDNGIGMSDGYDWKRSNTLGLRLVKDLVERQLNGSIKLVPGPGTRFIITFNIESPHK